MRTRSRLRFEKKYVVPALGALAMAACGGSSAEVPIGGTTGVGGDVTSSGSTSGTMTGSSTMSTGSGKGGATTTSTGSTGTGGQQPSCKADADCSANKAKPNCDTMTGECVGCLPASDTCMAGEWCDPKTETCTVGCKTAADCMGGNNLSCDPNTHQCVGCTKDGDCPLGSVCSGSSCTPGCNAQQGCQMGSTCCNSSCFDLQTDTAHCGMCDNAACAMVANGMAICTAGMCGSACNAAFADCNGDPADGCEQNVLQDGPCTCKPGDTQACYDGAPNTEGVGPCKGGNQTCDPSGTSWGPCAGEVLPQPEICANNIDDDCNGVKDDAADADKDGWSTCNGDCDDSQAVVNPGAFDVPGDSVDNDCNGKIDDVIPACSAAAKIATVTATDIAHAIDLCQFTTANPPLPQKIWGVISATQLNADGTVPSAAQLANMQSSQSKIMLKEGTGGIVPKMGATMAGISTGAMRDEADASFVALIGGTAEPGAKSIAFSPAPGAPLGTYTAAHGAALLPGKCGMGVCPVGSPAGDTQDVRLQIRVPTNAKSFSYDFRFFSAEYQSFQCTAFNDYYLAMLTTGAGGIPVDHNISFDALNNPVSVNNGFFQVCDTPNGKACGLCSDASKQLAGTGYETGGQGISGGSTTWLTTDAPVVPGETMTIEFVLFDVTDQIYDTAVLLDNFRWNAQPAVVGTHM